MKGRKELEETIQAALEDANKKNCNFNIVLLNPDYKGDFTEGSEYNFVTDKYLETPRTNCVLICKTDNIQKREEKVEEKSDNDTRKMSFEEYVEHMAKLYGMSSPFMKSAEESIKEFEEKSEKVEKLIKRQVEEAKRAMEAFIAVRPKPLPVPKLRSYKLCKCGSGMKTKKCDCKK